jgi:molecular chaperone DnaK (HSP70)
MAVARCPDNSGDQKTLAILDLGAGSTDASLLKGDDSVELIHLAGAGNMVNSMIASELGFTDWSWLKT